MELIVEVSGIVIILLIMTLTNSKLYLLAVEDVFGRDPMAADEPYYTLTELSEKLREARREEARQAKTTAESCKVLDSAWIDNVVFRRLNNGKGWLDDDMPLTEISSFSINATESDHYDSSVDSVNVIHIHDHRQS